MEVLHLRPCMTTVFVFPTPESPELVTISVSLFHSGHALEGVHQLVAASNQPFADRRTLRAAYENYDHVGDTICQVFE
jgi:hypothetical protein